MGGVRDELTLRPTAPLSVRHIMQHEQHRLRTSRRNPGDLEHASPFEPATSTSSRSSASNRLAAKARSGKPSHFFGDLPPSLERVADNHPPGRRIGKLDVTASINADNSLVQRLDQTAEPGPLFELGLVELGPTERLGTL